MDFASEAELRCKTLEQIGPKIVARVAKHTGVKPQHL
jgi:hypothetical protein